MPVVNITGKLQINGLDEKIPNYWSPGCGFMKNRNIKEA